MRPPHSKDIKSRKCKNLTLSELHESVLYSVHKIRQRHDQLLKITRKKYTLQIQQKAKKYLRKNEKLRSIALDLIHTIVKLDLAIENNITIEKKYLKKQTALIKAEIQLLHEMHYQIAKESFSFIHQYFSSKNPVLSPMVA